MIPAVDIAMHRQKLSFVTRLCYWNRLEVKGLMHRTAECPKSIDFVFVLGYSNKSIQKSPINTYGTQLPQKQYG